MSDDFTHILKYRLWDIANALRCNMNIFVFNNYILELLPHKSLSDKLLKYSNKSWIYICRFGRKKQSIGQARFHPLHDWGEIVVTNSKAMTKKRRLFKNTAFQVHKEFLMSILLLKLHRN